MSLKAVELQVALPRTQEISRMQDQLHHRNNHEQQQLIDDRKQLDQLTRQRPTNINESTGGKIKENHDEQSSQKERKQNQLKQGKEKSASRKNVQMTDPLRGHLIDISL